MARNIEQNQRMRDERYEKILYASLLCFTSRGFAATRISDIAIAAEMSQGLLYHYFPSKDDILIELIRGAFEKMNHAVSMLESMTDPPKEIISFAIRELLKTIEQSEHYARMVMLIAQAGMSDSAPQAVRDILQEESNKPYIAIRKILKRGQEVGTIKKFDPTEQSMMFWIAMKGLAMQRAVQGSDYKSPDPHIIMSMFFE